MPPSLDSLRQTLRTFAASPAALHILHTLRPRTTRTLHVLDSSFNPPTLAHRHLALSLLPHDTTLLLLLSTQNADKPPAPAAYEDRLMMMMLFAAALSTPAAVSVAITKHPYFLDKSVELKRHFPEAREHVYLTGYDTLIRILDTKYYPPRHTLEPLDEFFKAGRVRCMGRTGGAWGDSQEQEEYIRRIRDGEREGEGCRREWADKIELVPALEEEVSSTMVREAVRNEDTTTQDGLLTEEVKQWALQRGLYR